MNSVEVIIIATHDTTQHWVCLSVLCVADAQGIGFCVGSFVSCKFIKLAIILRHFRTKKAKHDYLKLMKDLFPPGLFMYKVYHSPR